MGPRPPGPPSSDWTAGSHPVEVKAPLTLQGPFLSSLGPRPPALLLPPCSSLSSTEIPQGAVRQGCGCRQGAGCTSGGSLTGCVCPQPAGPRSEHVAIPLLTDKSPWSRLHPPRRNWGRAPASFSVISPAARFLFVCLISSVSFHSVRVFSEGRFLTSSCFCLRLTCPP